MPRDRRDVADEVERELVVERGVDRVRRRDEKQRVTVRGRAHDGFGGDVGGCPGPVFDDELLAESLGQPLTDQARGDVGGAAGGKADDQAHRPRRNSLALSPTVTRPAARQRPRPDSENFGGEVSF
jgi:hypothetical protein